MKKHIAELELENEILKKATAIFARRRFTEIYGKAPFLLSLSLYLSKRNETLTHLHRKAKVYIDKS